MKRGDPHHREAGAETYETGLLTDALLHVAWVSAVVLVPVAALLALDAYRALGHGITGGDLVIPQRHRAPVAECTSSFDRYPA